MNFFDAILTGTKDKVFVEFQGQKLQLPKEKVAKIINLEDYLNTGKQIVFGVRPEDFHDEEEFIAKNDKSVIKVKVDVLEKLGSENLLYLNIDGKEGYTIARVDPRSSVEVNTTVKFAIDVKHIHIFDAETQQTMLVMDDAAEKR
jgi:multiple sugar transport system ATP-binding protein